MTNTITDAELVKRLRNVDVSWSQVGEDCASAADRIEALTADREALITARDMMGRQWAKDAEARLAAEARAERMEEALRPFAEALKGNWSMKWDSMKIVASPWATDLRIELQLKHFRNARAALKEDDHE